MATQTITERKTIYLKPGVVDDSNSIQQLNNNKNINNIDFQWVNSEEPHSIRRNEILRKHPEIRTLFTTEPLTCPIVLMLVSIQIYMCYVVTHYQLSWSYLLLLSYIIGGTINHTLQLAVHELSHNLCFTTPTYNKILSFICNMPTGVPSSITFQRYHIDHHQWQGYDGIDTDIPSMIEVTNVFNCVFKLIWVSLQPFVYAIRPMLTAPKEPTVWEGYNWATCMLFNSTIYYYFGSSALVYMLFGTLAGLGLHPCAGHFIAEHYTLSPMHETYSYYGICNYFNFNVGYHNEHHDFPRVPWSKLPLIKQYAPEYYDNLPFYTSYLYVFYKFITDRTVGCHSRIKRYPIQDNHNNVHNKNNNKDSRSKHTIAIAGSCGLAWAVLYIAYNVLY